MSGTFYILGLPLQEKSSTPPAVAAILEKSDLIVGESRKYTERILSRINLLKDAKVFYLDNMPSQEKKLLEHALQLASKQGQVVSLFSDMGMPILFDPGKEILDIAKKLDFSFRCIPGPTSWGTACALSGWNPPFFVVGFLPVKTEERQLELQRLVNAPGHLVLMDTPYRFLPLLADCLKLLGSHRNVFLAWEIGSSEEFYFWGTLKTLEEVASKRAMKKGEFILLIEQAGVK
jgi:16S rRNA (cytidine1402-2'-O)-methyltransferase